MKTAKQVLMVPNKYSFYYYYFFLPVLLADTFGLCNFTMESLIFLDHSFYMNTQPLHLLLGQADNDTYEICDFKDRQTKPPKKEILDCGPNPTLC